MYRSQIKKQWSEYLIVDISSLVLNPCGQKCGGISCLGFGAEKDPSSSRERSSFSNNPSAFLPVYFLLFRLARAVWSQSNVNFWRKGQPNFFSRPQSFFRNIMIIFEWHFLLPHGQWMAELSSQHHHCRHPASPPSLISGTTPTENLRQKHREQQNTTTYSNNKQQPRTSCHLFESIVNWFQPSFGFLSWWMDFTTIHDQF